MQFRKQLFSWVLCTFCFCLTLGALNTSAHAASVSCKTCGADLGSPVFKAKYDHYYCSACEKWFYYSFYVSAESGVEFVTVSPATCTSSGQGQYVCSTHGKGPLETSGSPLEHDWTEDHCIPAACLTPGSIDYVCSGCGETKQETIPALEHDYEETSRRKPTTMNEGFIKYTCSQCGDIRTESIPVLSSPDLNSDWLSSVMMGFEYVVILLGKVWSLLLSNLLLTLFLAAGLVTVGVKAFRKLKGSSKV